MSAHAGAEIVPTKELDVDSPGRVEGDVGGSLAPGGGITATGLVLGVGTLDAGAGYTAPTRHTQRIPRGSKRGTYDAAARPRAAAALRRARRCPGAPRSPP